MIVMTGLSPCELIVKDIILHVERKKGEAFENSVSELKEYRLKRKRIPTAENEFFLFSSFFLVVNRILRTFFLC